MNVCKKCGKPFGENVYAAQGYLYCTRECADMPDEYIEEVRADDILSEDKLVTPENSLTGRKRVVDILCRRDNIDEEEANYQIDSALAAMEEEGYEPYICEELMMDLLGLEPDYLFDLL